jgi:hypothetical protein
MVSRPIPASKTIHDHFLDDFRATGAFGPGDVLEELVFGDFGPSFFGMSDEV